MKMSGCDGWALVDYHYLIYPASLGQSLHSLVVERQSCKLKVPGSIPGVGCLLPGRCQAVHRGAGPYYFVGKGGLENGLQDLPALGPSY